MPYRSLESVWFTGNGCKQISLERIWQTECLRVLVPHVWIWIQCGHVIIYMYTSLLPTHHHITIPGHLLLSWLCSHLMAPVRHSRLILWAYNLCDLFFKCHSCWGWVWVISRIGFQSPCTSTREDVIFHPVFLPLHLQVLPIKRQGSYGLIITAVSTQPLQTNLPAWKSSGPAQGSMSQKVWNFCSKLLSLQ